MSGGGKTHTLLVSSVQLAMVVRNVLHTFSRKVNRSICVAKQGKGYTQGFVF
jgi:hypothetical protein